MGKTGLSLPPDVIYNGQPVEATPVDPEPFVVEESPPAKKDEELGEDPTETVPPVAPDLMDSLPEQTKMDSKEKQGAKFCGFCCDMRRAVIILNILAAIVLAINLIQWLAVQKILEDERVTAAIVLDALAFAGALSSILGAIGFKPIFVGIGLILVIGNYIGNIIVAISFYKYFEELGYELNWGVPVAGWVIGVVILLFYAYAHVTFITENKRGTMTKDNYENEEHSCCCV